MSSFSRRGPPPPVPVSRRAVGMPGSSSTAPPVPPSRRSAAAGARPGGRPAAAPRRGPRPPSMEHPDDVAKTAVAAPRRGPRPPSALHPSDVVSSFAESTASTSSAGDNKKKAGMVSRMGGKARKQIQRKHACERAFTCALAVSLLWLTSLVVATELTELFIPRPTFTSVEAAGRNMYDTALDQRSRYETCALSASSACQTAYVEDSTTEQGRLLAVQLNVTERLASIKQELTECAGAVQNTTDLFEYITTTLSFSLGSGTYVNAGPGCTQAALNAYLDREANAADALAQINSYQNTASSEVDGLEGALLARAAYDAEYLDNKTNGAFSELAMSLELNLTDPQAVIDAVQEEFAVLMACLDPSGTYPLPDGTPISCTSGTSIFADAIAQYNAMAAQYNSLFATMTAYYNTVEAKLANYEDFYQQLQVILGTLETAGLGSLLYLSGVELDFNDLLGSQLNPALASLRDRVPDADAAFQDVVAQAQAFNESLYAEGGLIEVQNALYRGDTAALTSTIFADYDPPLVEEDPEYEAASNSIVTKAATELKAVTDQAEGDPEAVFEEIDFNATEASSQLLEKADPRSWADVFFYEDDVFTALSKGLQSMNDYALAFDYAYRIIRSIMLIRKYWNISAVNTPPADVRTKSGIAAGTFKAKANIFQRIGRLLANPIFNILLFLLFVGLFSSTAYFTIKPLYDEYTDNCVNRCFQEISNTITVTCPNTAEAQLRYADIQTGDGTMIYRNLHALAFQFAFSDGDYVANTEIDALNVETELTCRESSVASIERQTNQDSELAFYNQRAAENIERVEFLRTCVNLDSLETAVKTSFPTETFEFSSLVRNATEPRCVRNFTSHEAWLETESPLQSLTDKDRDRQYNCSAIKPCNFGCTGPNEEVMRGTAFETGCTSEWYLQASLLGTLAAILIFLLSNLSRLVFMTGVVKLYWRHLSSHKFAFIASCREDGEVIYHEDVVSGDITFRKQIVKQLRVAIRGFEREGWLITLFGISLNIPWITLLVVLSNNLGFDADKICKFDDVCA